MLSPTGAGFALTGEASLAARHDDNADGTVERGLRQALQESGYESLRQGVALVQAIEGDDSHAIDRSFGEDEAGGGLGRASHGSCVLLRDEIVKEQRNRKM